MSPLFELARAFLQSTSPMSGLYDLLDAWRSHGFEARLLAMEGASAIHIAQEVSLEEADTLMSHLDRLFTKHDEAHTPWSSRARYVAGGAQIHLELHEDSGMPPYLQLTMQAT